MKYRKATIYDRTDATTAKTEPIDLEGLDIISRLQVRFEAYNSSAVTVGHPALCVSKIEILDGSDVLFSMSGQEIEAMDYFDTYSSRGYEIDYRNGMFTEEVFNINFGRYLRDEMLAFDPSRFKNPQLKITHNKALGGATPTSGYLTVLADVFDEKRVAPVGFLLNKEFYTYTPVASTYKTIKMPDDYVMRKMLLRMQYPPNTFTDNIDEIRLDENNLKKIPLDMQVFLYMSSILNEDFPYEEIAVLTVINGNRTVYITPTEYPAIALNPYAGAVGYVATERGGGEQIITSTGGGMCRMLVKGWLPHGCLPIRFGDQGDPDDWYDIRAIKPLNLRVHHPGSALGTMQVITQQLRRY